MTKSMIVGTGRTNLKINVASMNVFLTMEDARKSVEMRNMASNVRAKMDTI